MSGTGRVEEAFAIEVIVHAAADNTVVQLSERLVRRLYDTAAGTRWPVSAAAFADALSASVAKAFAGTSPKPDAVERYLASLHLTDLALACACLEGVDAAWEHLMREHRPALYRAADAIDPTGRARELADGLWADLFGGLLRYFHGRSSLATWLRAVLAQRHVDAVRASRRFEPLADMAGLAAAPVAPAANTEYELVRRALETAVAQLDARDRLRLACYHAQQLTLAQTGRVLREHEATVSRRLAQTRRTLRRSIERSLHDAGLSPAETQSCLEAVLNDPGPLDIAAILAQAGERKVHALDRSKRGSV